MDKKARLLFGEPTWKEFSFIFREAGTGVVQGLVELGGVPVATFGVFPTEPPCRKFLRRLQKCGTRLIAYHSCARAVQANGQDLGISWNQFGDVLRTKPGEVTSDKITMRLNFCSWAVRNDPEPPSLADYFRLDFLYENEIAGYLICHRAVPFWEKALKRFLRFGFRSTLSQKEIKALADRGFDTGLQA